jgi:hypothetical protein
MAPKTLLMTVEGHDGPPSLAEAAGQLKLDVSALSADFGVVLVDPSQRRYAVEVDASAVTSATAQGDGEPIAYSNPPIAPFAPSRGKR